MILYLKLESKDIFRSHHLFNSSTTDLIYNFVRQFRMSKECLFSQGQSCRSSVVYTYSIWKTCQLKKQQYTVYWVYQRKIFESSSSTVLKTKINLVSIIKKIKVVCHCCLVFAAGSVTGCTAAAVQARVCRGGLWGCPGPPHCCRPWSAHRKNPSHQVSQDCGWVLCHKRWGPYFFFMHNKT